MPNRDTTGPLGNGRMTGRGMGPCGAGMRRGFCWRRSISVEDEKKMLKEEAEEINKRLKELEN